MAIVFLTAVNATLKRTRTIQGDAGELATSTVTSTATGLIATGAFVDSGRQVQIDLAIQLWQEAEHVLYGMGLFPNEAATATISLATDGTREYSMPSDFERMAGDTADERVFRAVTDGLLITEYPGGYARMLRDQVTASDFTGDPNHYAFSPVNKSVRFDRGFGRAMTLNALYEKRLALTSTMATETLPFSDTVADALVPVVAEAHNRLMKKEFDSASFESSLVRALEHVGLSQRRRRYGLRYTR